MSLIRVQTQLQMPVLNRLAYSGLDEYIKETIEEAARAWLDAVLEIVPAWSGASRATFQALANSVGVNVPISRKQNAPDRVSLGRLYSRGGIAKERQHGYNFYYETTLEYLITNETKQVAPRTEGLFSSLREPTPYKFREAGNKAAAAVINSRLEEITTLRNLLDRKTF